MAWTFGWKPWWQKRSRTKGFVDRGMLTCLSLLCLSHNLAAWHACSPIWHLLCQQAWEKFLNSLNSHSHTFLSFLKLHLHNILTQEKLWYPVETLRGTCFIIDFCVVCSKLTLHLIGKQTQRRIHTDTPRPTCLWDEGAKLQLSNVAPPSCGDQWII